MVPSNPLPQMGARSRGARLASWLLPPLLLAAPAAAGTDATPIDYTQMSLEDLISIEIVSVSKKPEKMSDAAAAIFVITSDDIRRSGATSIPEALRMVPGVQAARIDGHKWAVSARGFNDRFANKLLVLIDGRTIYTPLYSGVFWESQGVNLEDIERIEVIRGPGATLWGANAVNGVINIITRPADAAPGTRLTVGAGDETRRVGSARHGGALGETADYRISAEYVERDASVDLAGAAAHDAWEHHRLQGRLDWRAAARDELGFQVNHHEGRGHAIYQLATLAPPYLERRRSSSEFRELSLQGRWTHTLSPTSRLDLHLFYSDTEVDDLLLLEERRTLDVEIQHPFEWGERHALVWGAGYRRTSDEIESRGVSFVPDERADELYNAFMQDDITLLRDRLRLTAGAKLEDNDYTGTEFQPNARLTWTPSPTQTVWGAVSRAVRTPSRYEAAVRMNVAAIPPLTPENPGPLPVAIQARGTEELAAEELLAWELGYRVQPTPRLALDVALFHNDYEELQSFVTGAPETVLDAPVPHVVSPLLFENRGEGRTWGAELAVDWHALETWRLHGAYHVIDADLDVDAAVGASGGSFFHLNSPRHQFSLRSSHDLDRRVDLDLWCRWVDAIASMDVPAAWNLDARLAWRLAARLELEVVGQNLLQEERLEFRSQSLPTMDATPQRGVYGMASWSF